VVDTDFAILAVAGSGKPFPLIPLSSYSVYCPYSAYGNCGKKVGGGSMATQTPVKSDSERLGIVEENVSVMRGDIAWLVEYFTPDDDGSDRFTRIEGRLDSLESKVDGLADDMKKVLEKLDA
jgi:hypothetical protein